MFYRLARLICRLILLLRRWEVVGAENLPQTGGVVVAANHTSYWDPVVIGCGLERKVHYMAKSELFAIPLLNPVIRALGAFPVRRDRSDRTAIRTAVQHLVEGRVIGLFPEGTRSHTGELLKPNPGAVLLAQKAGVPVLPVALTGTRGLLGKVTMRIGKPLMLFPAGSSRTGKAELEKASERVMAEIAGLLSGNSI